MQAPAFKRQISSTHNGEAAKNQAPIILPRNLFLRLLDFLEDKWGTTVSRRKNAFFREGDEEQPVAWLNSQELVTLVLIDQGSGRRNTVKIRIEDIELPAPIRADPKIYRSLLYQLVQSCGSGVVRWKNKFYESTTGRVVAELLSPEQIRLFDAKGPFISFRTLDLQSYASTRLPRELYFHLLDYLAQENGKEVLRMGNHFYPVEVRPILDSIKSTSAVSKNTLRDLRASLLAELVSKDSVRLAGGETRKIQDLVLTRRVITQHLYFCSSCQSFLRTPHRASYHDAKSGAHPIIHLSSNKTILPLEKQGRPSVRKEFSETLKRFWGIEQGRVPRKTLGDERKHHFIDTIPIRTARTPPRARLTQSTLLLFSAEIMVDGRQVSLEERRLALQSLHGQEVGEPHGAIREASLP